MYLVAWVFCNCRESSAFSDDLAAGPLLVKSYTGIRSKNATYAVMSSATFQRAIDLTTACAITMANVLCTCASPHLIEPDS